MGSQSTSGRRSGFAREAPGQTRQMTAIFQSPMDVVVLTALVVSFAVLCTAHVALAFGLVLERPRWRGPVALLVPPLAPYWGMERGMKRRAGIWVVALTVYVLARILAEI